MLASLANISDPIPNLLGHPVDFVHTTCPISVPFFFPSSPFLLLYQPLFDHSFQKLEENSAHRRKIIKR